jgi:hypothetical protein
VITTEEVVESHLLRERLARMPALGGPYLPSSPSSNPNTAAVLQSQQRLLDYGAPHLAAQTRAALREAREQLATCHAHDRGQLAAGHTGPTWTHLPTTSPRGAGGTRR